MALLMKFKGWDFKRAATEVEGVVGLTKHEPTRPPRDPHAQNVAWKRLWKECRPIQSGDHADQYLDTRGVGEIVYPPDLTFCSSCYYDKGASLPAMVAMVRDEEGNPVTLHRTFLGSGRKADVANPRKLMPGKIPAGAAIRLGDPQSELGIAEGIETALAAMQRFDLPVWAAIDAGKLTQWSPPPEARHVYVFGDNDRNYTGQSAAFELAKRLHRTGLEAYVKIPVLPDTDWADEARGSYRRDITSTEDQQHFRKGWKR